MFKKVRNPFREKKNDSSSASGHFTKSAFNELTTNMDTIMKACGKITNLNNSPPYILSILPDIHTILHKIVTEHDRDFQSLADNDYFQVAITNLSEKCKELKRILKNDPSSHHILKSSMRRELSKYSLVFSHILHELNVFFTDGTFSGGRFKITKADAKAFWEKHFGAQAVVHWSVFKRELAKVHSIDNSIDVERALQETLQLTKSNFVSKFEFDVFTRLFQPWEQLLVNWKVLAVTHPGYTAFITYEELHEELQPHRDSVGAYAFRLSNTKLGQWAIGYVNQSGEILQTIPENKSLMKVLIDGERNGYYTKPKGRLDNPDLSKYLHETKPENIEVPEESVQIYFDMGTTFNLCKVCLDRDKDIRIEPCNHLVCADCVAKWKMKDNSPTPTCPFCRCDIRDTVPIRFDKDRSSDLEANRPLPPIPVDRTGAPPPSSAINDLYVNEIDDSTTPPPFQAVEVPCPPVRNSLLGAENPAFEYNQLSPEPTRCASTSDQNINSAGIAAPPIPPRKLS